MDYAAYQMCLIRFFTSFYLMFYVSWCLRRFRRRKDDNVVTSLSTALSVQTLQQIYSKTFLFDDLLCLAKILFWTTFVEAIFGRKLLSLQVLQFVWKVPAIWDQYCKTVKCTSRRIDTIEPGPCRGGVLCQCDQMFEYKFAKFYPKVVQIVATAVFTHNYHFA